VQETEGLGLCEDVAVGVSETRDPDLVGLYVVEGVCDGAEGVPEGV